MKWMTTLVLLAASVAVADDKIQVVTSMPTLKAIADEVGGDKVEVTSIGKANQDPHFVDPKPTYQVLLLHADLVLVYGLELEIGWIPPLTDGSHNPKVIKGHEGYVDCSPGVSVLDVPPPGTTRVEGDVHPLGNPHYITDPIRAKVVAQTIADAFSKVQPGSADYFADREKAFEKKVDRAMFGDALVEAVGGSKLCEMLEGGQLWDFLATKGENGQPLSTALGGWLASMAPARGKNVVFYHKNMEYFADRFGLKIVDYVEPKPGIPPTADHLVALVDEIKKLKVPVLVRQVWYEKNSTDVIGSTTGIKVLNVPLECGGENGTDTYIGLIDYLTKTIGGAYK